METSLVFWSKENGSKKLEENLKNFCFEQCGGEPEYPSQLKNKNLGKIKDSFKWIAELAWMNGFIRSKKYNEIGFYPECFCWTLET